MNVSKCVCKTFLKELGTLWKCRETFEKFLAACNSFKNTGLPQFFSQVSDNYILRTPFPIINQKVPIILTFMNSKLTKITDKDNQNHILQKSKPYEISRISSIWNIYSYIDIYIFVIQYQKRLIFLRIRLFHFIKSLLTIQFHVCF